MDSLRHILGNPEARTSSASTVLLVTSVAVLVGLVVAVASVMGLLQKNQMPVEGRTILLTGATEGMGRSAARYLSEQGANVIIVSRNLQRLEEALAEIKAAAKSPSQRFHFISADVSEPDYAARIVTEASEWNGRQAPDIVWCVAGMSTPMLWVDSEDALAATRRNMDVNFWGTAEMAHAILRAWYDPAKGGYKEPKHLVFTTSVIIFCPIVGYGAYAPSKWALRGLADTLVQETLLYPDHPVKIHVVTPGTILSPGFEREQLTKPEITMQIEKDDPRMTPDEVAAAAIKGLQKGHYFVTVAFLGDLMRWGVMGGSTRNNWVIDTLGAWILSLAWFFILWIVHGDIKAYGKKYGHPINHPKRN